MFFGARLHVTLAAGSSGLLPRWTSAEEPADRGLCRCNGTPWTGSAGL